MCVCFSLSFRNYRWFTEGPRLPVGCSEDRDEGGEGSWKRLR